MTAAQQPDPPGRVRMPSWKALWTGIGKATHIPPGARIGVWLPWVFRAVLLLLLYAAVSGFLLESFMTKWGFRDDSPEYGLHAMLSGTAHRPFVYRVLSPAIIRTLAEAVPDEVADRLSHYLLVSSPLKRFRVDDEVWDVAKSLRFHIGYLYLFGVLLLTMFAGRALVASVYPAASRLALDLAPVVGGLFLPLTFRYGGFMYDFPELLFLGLASLCVIKALWVAYYLIFVLAVLNKEADVLLVAFFVAIAWNRIPRRAIVMHALVQTALGVGVVLSIRAMFHANAGAPTEFQLAENLLFWSDYRSYFLSHSPYAPLIRMPQGLNVITLFLVAVAIAWQWRLKPPEVRRLLIASFLCNPPLLLLFSYRDEIRNLSLVFPALYLAAFQTITSVYGALESTRPGVASK